MSSKPKQSRIEKLIEVDAEELEFEPAMHRLMRLVGDDEAYAYATDLHRIRPNLQQAKKPVLARRAAETTVGQVTCQLAPTLTPHQADGNLKHSAPR